MKKNNKILLATIVLLAAIALALWYFWDKVEETENGNTPSAVVNNFEECLSAGYVVSESYPRQCQTPDGRTFIEDIGNEQEKSNLISISTPRPNDVVQSPLWIEGEARGGWFFEGDFPIRIYDANGKELGVAVAQAEGNWMTQDFVPFHALLEFENPETETGKLVLEKDNPSDIRELDDSLIVPIKFGQGSQSRKISLFYYNQSKDRDATGNIKCSKDGLDEVKRNISQGNDMIEKTINLLLQGNLTQSEKAMGISTEFPLEGLELENSSLDDDGNLTLTFKDPQNRTSGGSCRTGVLWNQIEATAMQFSQVKSVKFMPEELFQP